MSLLDLVIILLVQFFVMMWKGFFNPRVDISIQAQDCLFPMGITSENVAKRYGVSRHDQDQVVVESHKHATATTVARKFTIDIIPIEAYYDIC